MKSLKSLLVFILVMALALTSFPVYAQEAGIFGDVESIEEAGGAEEISVPEGVSTEGDDTLNVLEAPWTPDTFDFVVTTEQELKAALETTDFNYGQGYTVSISNDITINNDISIPNGNYPYICGNSNTLTVNAKLSFNTDIDIYDLNIVNNGEIYVSRSISLSGDVTNNGKFSLGNMTTTITGDVYNSSSGEFTAGGLKVIGDFINDGAMKNYSVLVMDTFTNNKPILIYGILVPESGTLINNSTITNPYKDGSITVGGTFVNNNTLINNSKISLFGTFINNGVFEDNNDNSLYSSGEGGVFTGTGTISGDGKFVPKIELAVNLTFGEGRAKKDGMIFFISNHDSFGPTHFDRVEVDGKAFPASTSVPSYGNLAVTLAKEDLNTLDFGTHAGKIFLKNGLAGSYDFTIDVGYDPLESISFAKQNVLMLLNSTSEIDLQFTPKFVASYAANVYSSNAAIVAATYDSSTKKITLNTQDVQGTATITAIAQVGTTTLRATLSVKVIKAATGLTIISNAPFSITRDMGTLSLGVTTNPADAGKDVVWSVSPHSTNQKGKAAISEDGILSAQKNGWITVRATAPYDNNVFATQDVEITGQNEFSYALKFGPRLSAATFTMNQSQTEPNLLWVRPLAPEVVVPDSLTLDSELFEITYFPDTDGLLYLIALTEAGKAADIGNYSAALNVTTDADTYKYKISFKIVNEKPNVSLKTLTVNLFYPDANYAPSLSSKFGKVALVGIDTLNSTPEFSKNFEVVDNKLKVKTIPLEAINGKPALTGCLLVCVEGYAPQSIKTTIKTKNAADKFAISPSKITLNRIELAEKNYKGEFYLLDTSVKPSNRLKIESFSYTENEMYKITSGHHHGGLEIELYKDKISSKTSKITINVNVKAEGWASEKPITITIDITNSYSVSYSAMSITINARNWAGDPKFRITPNQKNVVIEGLVIQNLPGNTSRNVYFDKLSDGSVDLVFENYNGLDQGRYRLKVTPVLKDGIKLASKIITVYVYKTDNRLKGSVSGTANYMNPNAGLKVKFKTYNAKDTVISAEVWDDDVTMIYADGKLRMRTDYYDLTNEQAPVFVKNQTLGAWFKIETAMGFWTTGDVYVTFKPSSTMPKLTKFNTATLYSGVNKDNNLEVVPIKLSFGNVYDLWLPDTVRNAKIPENLMFGFDGDNILITLDDNAGSKTKPGTYLLDVNIVYKGQPAVKVKGGYDIVPVKTTLTVVIK